MTLLYIQEYSQHLAGKKIAIACREGILREHLSHIVTDIKFLNRLKISTFLFHNIPNRFANQKILNEINRKLPENTLCRINPTEDFYASVLAQKEAEYKLIFLERSYLRDRNGKKINTFTTKKFRTDIIEIIDSVQNVNFRDALIQICEVIDSGRCQRIHILPAKKDSIKKELFSLEGSGTMIANDFTEKFRKIHSEQDATIVSQILNMHKTSGFLKKRSKEYILNHYENFFVTSIDDIIVGCIEKKIVDESTVELAALAISSRFLNQQIGVYTITAFIETMRKKGINKFIVLTKNPRLQKLVKKMGFALDVHNRWAYRQSQSPGVSLFFINFD